MVEGMVAVMRDSPGELALGTLAALRGEDCDEAEAAALWWCETAMGWRKAQEK